MEQQNTNHGMDNRNQRSCFVAHLCVAKSTSDLFYTAQGNLSDAFIVH